MAGLSLKRLVALTLLVLTQGRVFHASPINGSDDNTGLTAYEPLETLCACIDALEHAGDECHLHTGTYEVGERTCNVTGLNGTPMNPILITSAGE
jgi:hypothetical protein